MSITADIFYNMMQRVVAMDIAEELFYFAREDGTLCMAVNCNDLFYWATSDAEDITPDNIEELEKAMADVKTASPNDNDFVDHGMSLFACRVRKMRPQPPCYKTITPELHALFNACGPERDPSSCG